jgi:hypothetical protein
MDSSRVCLALALAAALFSGCSNATPEGIEASPIAPGSFTAGLSSNAAPAVPDISGTWNWRRDVQLTAPTWAAELIFGIQPEGPITHMRCESFGTMELNQAGATFSGTAVRETITCETKGGQVFAPAHPAITIADGTVSGQSIHYTLVEHSMVMIPCPNRGVISQLHGTTATRMGGTGRCLVPGHPQSPVPLDPPPAGTSKTLSWEAWR